MENTVEALLSHGGPPSELIRKLPTLPSGGSANSAAGRHTIDTDAELARRLAAEDERRSNSSSRRPEGYRGMEHGTQQSGFGLATGRSNYQNTRRPPQRDAGAAPQNFPPRRPAPSPPAGTKGIGTPTTLPKDFLRIPGRTPDTALDSASSGQQMTDEQMARMLQDELFQEELRNNPEFSHLAGRGGLGSSNSARIGGFPGQQQSTGRSTYAGAGAASGVGWGERTDFFDRVSELGDQARSRFQQFAANWNENRAAGRPLFGGGPPAAPQQRMNESRGLLSNDLGLDDEEEEMAFVGGDSNSFEMQDKKKD